MLYVSGGNTPAGSTPPFSMGSAAISPFHAADARARARAPGAAGPARLPHVRRPWLPNMGPRHNLAACCLLAACCARSSRPLPTQHNLAACCICSSRSIPTQHNLPACCLLRAACFTCCVVRGASIRAGHCLLGAALPDIRGDDRHRRGQLPGPLRPRAQGLCYTSRNSTEVAAKARRVPFPPKSSYPFQKLRTFGWLRSYLLEKNVGKERTKKQKQLSALAATAVNEIEAITHTRLDVAALFL